MEMRITYLADRTRSGALVECQYQNIHNHLFSGLAFSDALNSVHTRRFPNKVAAKRLL